ncbi:VOC family protein [Paraflavitalea speifideaquila]|uniref:VOC family protein n=1 Tax=Paraflavitalea speifideaquila TaxID=3076558 RepID=UPI0028E66D36|nr:VOC family protein [Paraflavitalea speifideiaquila]
MQNKQTITHIEIPAPDLAAAMAFYATVFQWEIIRQGDNYAFFRIGDTNSGGGLDPSLQPALEKQGVQVVIDVEDIDTTLATIVHAGGRIDFPKTAIDGGHGFYAGFCDPNNNHIQLHGRQ